MNTIYFKIKCFLSQGETLGFPEIGKSQGHEKATFLFHPVFGLLTFLVAYLFVFSNPIAAQTTYTVSFTTSGNTSWPLPSGVTSFTVEAWGGGGGGGGGYGRNSDSPLHASGGGGGGGYSKSVLTVASVGAGPYTVGVGSGGGGGAKGSNGTQGNTSYFKDLSTFSAVGGNSGVGGNTTAGAGGVGAEQLGTSTGSSVGNVITYKGGNGAAGIGTAGTSSYGGAGGSSGGTAANGGNASGTTKGTVAGGGSGGKGDVYGLGAGQEGEAGANPGGGGAGSLGESTGKAGGSGKVIIYYQLTPTLVIGTSPTPVIAANICPGINNVPLHSFSLTGANNPGTITSISVNLTGTYLTGDIANLRLYSTGTSSTFAMTTPVGSAQVSPAGVSPAVRTVTFSSGSNIPYALGNATHYFWLVMDVTGSAASSRTIYATGTLPVNITATPTPTGFSNLSGVQTLGIGATPTAPVATTPSAANIACTSFNATWNASAATSGYFLDVSTSPTFASYVLGNGTNSFSVGNVLTYNVTGLTAATTYYYRVRADKCGATSTNSNVITVTTTATPAAPGAPTVSSTCNPVNITLTRNGAPGANINWYWQGTDAAGTSTSLNSTSSYNTTTSGTYYIRSQTTGGCWGGSSNTGVLTASDVTPGTIGSNQSICGSTVPVAFTNELSGTGTGLGYQWQSGSSTTAFADISGATASTYSSGLLVTTTYFRRKATAGICSDYSNIVEVTVAAAPTITASADVTICSGSSTNLSASGSNTNTYSWLNTSYLSNDAISNPVCTPPSTYTVTTINTYTVTGWGISTEKVINGNFNTATGSLGFTSDYAFWPMATVGDMSEGKYFIGTQGKKATSATTTGPGVHSAFSTTLDHTGGATRNQLVVNGAGNPGANIWCETFAVAANSDYAFSTWLSSQHLGDGTPNGLAKLQFSINGIAFGSVFSAPATIGPWNQFFLNWNSGTSTSAKICVVNQTTVPFGNDFALDDISFAPYCSSTDIVNVTTSVPILSSTLTPPAICSGSTFAYTATSAYPTPTFAWTRAAVAGVSNGASSGTGNVSEVLTLSAGQTTPVNVTYRYRTTSGGCAGIYQDVVVTVNPKATLSSSLTPAAICSGTAFNYQATSSISGATFSWARATVAGITETGTSGSTNPVNETLTNTTGVTVNVTYVYTTAVPGCAGSVQNVVVSVKAGTKLSSTLTPSAICSGTALSYTATSATAGASFAWSRAAVAGISQALASGSSNPLSDVALTNTTGSAVNVTYVYTTTANGCSNDENVVVSVKPKPQLNTPLTDAICSGSTYAYTPASGTPGPPSFSWTRAAVAGINGGVAGSGTSDISEVLTNSTTAAINVTYVYTTTLNGCSGATQNLVVTVNPIPVLSSALSANICSSNTFTYTATSATSGATFTWNRAAVTGITNGAAAGTTLISEVLVNTTTANVNVNYFYVTTANGCSNAGQNLVVTVNPKPVLTSTLTPGPICSGTVFNYTPTSATAGPPTFAWTRAAVAGISNTLASGTGNPAETLVNTTAADVDVTYAYVSTMSSCPGPSQNVTVTVRPSPQGNFIGNTVCAASTDIPQLTFSATSGTGPFTLVIAPASGVSNPVTTNTPWAATPPPNITVPAVFEYTLTQITDAKGCVRNTAITTPTASIVVTGDPISTNAATPRDSITCAAVSVSFHVVATGVQTYSWEVNTTGADGGAYNAAGPWVAVAGTEPSPIYNGYTSSTLSLNNVTTAHSGNRYRSVLTPACGATVYSNIALLTVNPKPTFTSSLAPSPDICSGTTVVYSPTATGVGAITFAWTRAAVPGITTAAASSGSGASPGAGAITTHTLTNTTTDPIAVTYAYVVTDAGNNCVSATQNVVFTVNPKPTLSSITGTVASLCSPSLFTYTPASAYTGSTYAWTRNTPAGISSVAAAISGTAGISQTLTNSTTANVNVTYTYTTTANTCPSDPQTVVVTVKPSPVLDSPIPPADICTSVNNFNYSISSATAGASFDWTRATVAGITEVGASGTASAPIIETLTNTTNAAITVRYVNTTTANGCAGSAQNIDVLVKPIPNITSAIAQSVCSDAVLTYTPLSNVAGATFAWTRSALPAGITTADAASGTDGLSQTLTNSTSAPIDVTYVYTATADLCDGPAKNVVITVNPNPTVSSSATPAAVCSETTVAFAYTATSATPGTTFAWTRAAVTGINDSVTAGSGTGNVSEVLTNHTTSALTVRYVYTPTANGCVGTVKNVDVSVKPRPVLSSGGTSTICTGTAITYSATSATGGGAATFAWSRAAVTGISNAAATGTANPIGETLINTTTAPINVDYIYTTTFASCASASANTVVVTVNPKPTMTSAAVATICTGTSLATNGTLTFTSDLASDYSWTRAGTANITTGGNGAATSSGACPCTNPIAEVLDNALFSPVSTTYVVTPTSNPGGCVGTAQSVVVEVSPIPDTPNPINGNSPESTF